MARTNQRGKQEIRFCNGRGVVLFDAMYREVASADGKGVCVEEGEMGGRIRE